MTIEHKYSSEAFLWHVQTRTDPLDSDDGGKLKGLVLAGVMGRGSIMSLDYNGNEGMREALLAVLDAMEGPPTTARRGPGRPRKGVDWAVERHRLARPPWPGCSRATRTSPCQTVVPLLEALGDLGFRSRRHPLRGGGLAGTSGNGPELDSSTRLWAGTTTTELPTAG